MPSSRSRSHSGPFICVFGRALPKRSRDGNSSGIISIVTLAIKNPSADLRILDVFYGEVEHLSM